MRSISYILTGQPRNRTDCIDCSQRRPAKEICLKLMTNETASDEFIAKNLYATYVWVFEDRVVTYEEPYGRIIQHEPHERQCLSIDNANRRLAKALENLREQQSRPPSAAEALHEVATLGEWAAANAAKIIDAVKHLSRDT